MTEIKKLPKVTTPAGTAAYAWINKPDEGHVNSDGKYKVTLLLDNDDAATEAFVEKITKMAHDLAKQKWGKVPADLMLPFRDGDEAAEEKEGKEGFAGHTFCILKTKYQPDVVDAKRKPVPPKLSVMSGDLIRASALLTPYETTETVREGGKKKTVTVYGMTFRLRNLQLLEKRSGMGASNDFDDVDGYDGIAGDYEPEAEDQTGGNTDDVNVDDI